MSRPHGAPVFASLTSQIRRSASPMLRVAAIVAAFGSFAFEGGFRGCGNDVSSPDGTLPEGEPPECLVDSDCVAPMCSDATCIAGRCQTSATMIDNDRDGQIAAPCGPDCDDGNPNVSPLLAESCDGIDNDCDMAVDEDAPSSTTAYPVSTQVLAAAGLATLPGVMLFSVDPGAGDSTLTARWFDLGPSGALVLERIATFVDEQVSVAALPTTGGVRVLWSVPSEHVVREASIGITSAGSSVSLSVGPTTDVVTGMDVVSMRAVEAVGSYALLLDVLDAGTGNRVRHLAVPGSTPVALPYTDGSFDLAARDTRFYTPSGDSEIAVIDAGGHELRRVVLPGPSATDAVVSWNGRILAPSADLSDFTLREITVTDTLGEGWPLRTGFGGPDIAVHPLSSRLAVTRMVGYVDLSFYDDTFSIVSEFTSLPYPSTETFTYREVVETSVGPAVVLSEAPGLQSYVVALQCAAASL